MVKYSLQSHALPVCLTCCFACASAASNGSAWDTTTSVIVGGAVGGAVLLLVFVVSAYVYLRSKRNGTVDVEAPAAQEVPPPGTVQGPWVPPEPEKANKDADIEPTSGDIAGSTRPELQGTEVQSIKITDETKEEEGADDDPDGGGNLAATGTGEKKKKKKKLKKKKGGNEGDIVVEDV